MEASSTRFTVSQTYQEIIKTFITRCPRSRHSRLLTTVDDSFTGKEAVNFFLETFPVNPFSQQELTREKAVKLLDLFLREGHFHRVGTKPSERKAFKDNGTLYCFKKPEKREDVQEKVEISQDSIEDSPAVDSDDSQDSGSEEIKTRKKTSSFTYKYDPIPLLNKVDLWNAYKTAFEYRVQELIPYQDLIANWKIRGQDIQKNCEQDPTTAPFAENIMALMNYLMKLPFSKRNPNSMAAFKCLCEGMTLEPVFLTEEESAAILLIFQDLSYKLRPNSNATSIFLEVAEETFVAIVRLFLLTIPPNRRWKLLALFRVMNKIALDDYSGNTMQMVLEYLSNLVVPCEKLNSNQAMFIVQMLLCSFDEIFAIDRELLEIVEKIKKNIMRSKEIDYCEITRRSSTAWSSTSTSPSPSSITVPSPALAVASSNSLSSPASREEMAAIPKKPTVKESYQSMYDMLDELNQANEGDSLVAKQDAPKMKKKLLSCVTMNQQITRY